MTTYLMTTTPHHAYARRLARAALFTAALALAASPFANPAIAHGTYDADYYAWCMTNLGQGKSYCCQQAGGFFDGDNCIDPARLYTPAPPTLNQNPGPIIIGTAP